MKAMIPITRYRLIDFETRAGLCGRRSRMKRRW